MMRTGLLIGVSAAALLAAAAPGRPADHVLAPAPVATAAWTGLYGGVHSGGAWGTNSWRDPSAFFGGAPPFVDGAGDADGAVIGGQLGYNYRLGNVVLSAEA